MELGYIGIAYNRTIKGEMSDHDRCSIFLLLRQSPPWPPQCSTRLTVCVENHSQALALNSGNPILKTYDLVTVKPEGVRRCLWQIRGSWFRIFLFEKTNSFEVLTFILLMNDVDRYNCDWFLREVAFSIEAD